MLRQRIIGTGPHHVANEGKQMHDDNPRFVHERTESCATHQSDGMLNAILRPCDKLKHRNSLLCHPTLYPTIRVLRNRKTAKKYPLLFIDLVCKRRPVCGLIGQGLHTGRHGRQQQGYGVGCGAGDRGSYSVGVARVVGVALLMLLLVGAGPATKPATTVYELRKQIESLQSEVDALRGEVEAMRMQIDRLKPPTSQPAKDEAKKPKTGMTIDEANKLMGRAGILVYEDVNGATQYKWPIVVDRGYDVGRTYVPAAKEVGAWYATFEAGKITAVSRAP
jgi:cell division protein FtsB